MHELDLKKIVVESKKIRDKAIKVALRLGSGFQLGNPSQELVGEEHKFTGPDMQITYRIGCQFKSAVFSGLDIVYMDRCVFYEGGGKLFVYVSGDWENELNKLAELL